MDALARKTLGGFRADWNTWGPQQVQSAPWLLIDEGNPFFKRPIACLFERDGQRQTLKLEWMRVKRETLLPRLQAAIGGGAWPSFHGVHVGSAAATRIALQSLKDERTPPLWCKEVEAQEGDVLRCGALRGAGSARQRRRFFALRPSESATSLFGPDFVQARLDHTTAAQAVVGRRGEYPRAVFCH